MPTEEQKDLVYRLMETIMRFKGLHRHEPNSHTPLRREMILFHSILEDSTAENAEGLRINELARRLAVRPPTITQMVAELERRGFVERVADPDDRRSVRVLVTQQGRDLAARQIDRMRGVFKGLVETLGPGQTEELIRLLHISFDYLNQIHTPNDSDCSKGSEPCSDSTDSSF